MGGAQSARHAALRFEVRRGFRVTLFIISVCRSGIFPPFHHAYRIEIFVRYSFRLRVVVNDIVFIITYGFLWAEVQRSLATRLFHFMANLH